MPDRTPLLPRATEVPPSVAALLDRELTAVRILANTEAHLVRTSGRRTRRTLCGRDAAHAWPAYGSTVSGACGGCAEVAVDVADALTVLHNEREQAGGHTLTP